MKRIISVIISFLLLFITQSCVLAENSPTSAPNNKYGIHIFSEKDLDSAAKLVNSEGGDWGYATLVITEAERDHDRWQQVFDQMRRLHLIPIVRLATKANGNIWEAPTETEINNWIAFLNSLNWVIQNRYVVISNEPNHAAEWGGKIDPAGYATYLKSFSQKLKSASSDFFILPAGLDASATNSSETMDETRFLQRMIAAEPDVFNFSDGWTSHSYPNPAFSGSEKDKGKGTIATFDWELTYLKNLGVTKDLPVFITETGWSNKSLGEDDIAKRLVYAYQNVWNDSRIVAVTPFILDYEAPPFNVFSWQKSDRSFYKFYASVQNLPKTAGQPVQITSGQIVAAVAQPVVLSGSDFLVAILARNTGQSIWNTKQIVPSGDSNNVSIQSYSFLDIEPAKLGLIILKAAAPENAGIYSRSLFLSDNKGRRITNSFPIEAIVTKLDKMQIGSFFAKIGSYLRLNFY